MKSKGGYILKVSKISTDNKSLELHTFQINLFPEMNWRAYKSYTMTSKFVKGKVVSWYNLSLHYLPQSTETGRRRNWLLLKMSRQISCDLCPKAFKSKKGLIYHKQAHSGVKNYNCPHCNKSFCADSNLRRHILIHTEEKPHKCTECNFSCNRSW